MNYITGPAGIGYRFQIFQILFLAAFVFAAGTFLVSAVKGILQWNQNNHAPTLTVPAAIVAKRTHVARRRRGGANGHHHYTTSTTYFVTFQVESGDRMELKLSGQEYGLLAEGDRGDLTFQGTRYLGFERT